MSPVYVAGQGDRYHSKEDCPAIQRGQLGGEVQGYEKHPIAEMDLTDAEAAGKDKCRECWRA